MLNEYLYVDEWIQYNIFLGFDLIHIYDNTVNGSNYLRNLQNRYGHYINYTHHPGQGAQTAVYERCLLTYQHRKVWAAFIDVDEFIVLRKHTSIGHFLYDVKGNKGGAIYVNWVMFGPNHHIHYKNELVLKRFTLRGKHVDPLFMGKTISYLPDVGLIDAHVPKYIRNKTDFTDAHGRNYYTRRSYTENIIAVYHYYTKSFEGIFI